MSFFYYIVELSSKKMVLRKKELTDGKIKYFLFRNFERFLFFKKKIYSQYENKKIIQ